MSKRDVLSLKIVGVGLQCPTLEVEKIQYFTSEKLRAGNEKEEAKVSGCWEVK